MTLSNRTSRWPELPALSEWQTTLDTVHRWTQIIGKVRLARNPWVNHAWHVPFYVSSTGLTTSAIPFTEGAFSVDFDFIEHRIVFAASTGERVAFALEPMSVADFYGKTMATLDELGAATRIWPMPVEIPDPIEPFPEDEVHHDYDPEAIHLYWLALVEADRVLHEFRSRFIGKVSPVHLFWGAFDLAVTRFSGRRAPRHPGGAPHCPDWVMQEAYSHEVSSAGFWPGQGLGYTAFYSYAYPEPRGFRDYAVRGGAYHEGLREYVMSYDEMRQASDPDAHLLEFFQSTYEAAAELGRWNRAELEGTPAHAA